MTLEETVADDGTRRLRLTECPFCGMDFPEELNGAVVPNHLLAEHSPEVLNPDYSGPAERQTNVDEWGAA